MRNLYSLLLVLLASMAVAQHQPRNSEKRDGGAPYPKIAKRTTWLNNATEKFWVNGSAGAIPDVDFDIGESYAGLLPISSNAKDANNQLWFWFFPTTNPLATNEILLYLAGGPGCSGLLAFLNENGRFTWQIGTLKPNDNPWAYTNLTNVIWVDQPIGTGFSTGDVTITNEKELAAQFLGFWKNFITTFSLQGYKTYIAGESYAGRFVPYVADAMFTKNDTVHYNIKGTMLNDALIAHNNLQLLIPLVPYVKSWNNLFQLNDTIMAEAQAVADGDECNFTAYMDENLAYPPPANSSQTYGSCQFLGDAVLGAIQTKNPCFDLFQITNYCPLQWDVTTPPKYPGYPTYDSQGAGNLIYFDRPEVKAALNAPNVTFEECTTGYVFIDGDDTSPVPYRTVYPRVIEMSERTVLAHGALDMAIIANGTLLTVQLMTWNGTQGFTAPPTDKFVIPPRPGLDVVNRAGSGEFGTTRTERGLTWVQIDQSGHMLPQYAPAAAYRILEFLLGRIDSLTN